MSDLPVYYTPEQVAEMFGLKSANYLLENIARFPHIRIARKVRFTAEHVDQIARDHERRATVPTSSATLGRRTRTKT